MCDLPRIPHRGPVGEVEVHFRRVGAILTIDVCEGHEAVVTLEDARRYGRRVRRRKPSTRPAGAEGMADMFDPHG